MPTKSTQHALSKSLPPKVLRKQARRVALWGLARLGLSDWKIASLHIRETPPIWAETEIPDSEGIANWWGATKRVKLWISPSRCRAEGSHVYFVILHELIHVALDDSGFLTSAEDSAAKEFFVNRYAHNLIALYLSGV